VSLGGKRRHARSMFSEVTTVADDQLVIAFIVALI
jgi:hypothetical protein